MALTIWDPTLQQHVDVSRPKQATGTTQDLNSSVELELGGRGSVGMVLTATGVFNGLLGVELSVDGGETWITASFVNHMPLEQASAIITGVNSAVLAAGQGWFSIPLISGATHVRVVEYSGSTEPVAVVLTATYGPEQPLPVIRLNGYGSAPSSIHAMRGIVDSRGSITTTDAAYSAGDVIGGKVSLGPAIASTASVTLRSLTLKDDKNQKPGLQVLFFRTNPAGTYTDNAAVAPSTADMSALVGMVEIAAADWVTIQGTTKAVVVKMLDLPLTPADVSLWMVLVATTTPDYAANSTDLTFSAEFEQGA